jgi:hypothetical protein
MTLLGCLETSVSDYPVNTTRYPSTDLLLYIIPTAPIPSQQANDGRFAGNNEMYVGIHADCPRFLPTFKQIWNFSTDFHKGLEKQSSRKSVQWERRC